MACSKPKQHRVGTAAKKKTAASKTIPSSKALRKLLVYTLTT